MQQLLLKGNMALDHQQYEQAVRYYEEATKLDPCFGDALNNIGTARFRGGRIDEAILWYDKAITCSPRYDFLLNRANAHFENKAFFSAAEDAKRLLRIAPDSVDVLTLKGLIMSRLGRYDSALVWFDRVVENNPEAAESWVNRGTLHYYRKDFEAASHDLRKALQLDPTHPAALNAMAMVSADRNLPDSAMYFVTAALAKEPRHPHYLNNRGYFHILRNELRQAEEDINASMSIEPDNAWVYRNRGIIYFKSGKFKDAERLFRQVLSMDSSVDKARMLLGLSLAESGNPVEGCKWLRGQKPDTYFQTSKSSVCR